MKDNVSCEMVKDVLPAYVEKQTSAETNNLVEEHIKECETCKKALEEIKEKKVESLGKEKNNLKKKTKFIIIGCSILAVLLIAIFVRYFVIGGSVYNEEVLCEAKVEGNKLTLIANMIDKNLGISSINFRENNGTLFVDVRAVKGTIFYKSNVKKAYTANEKISKVYFNTDVLWENGLKISDYTNKIYFTKHDYIGDAIDNKFSTDALGISDTIGRFTNELQTDKEPYEWKIIFDDEFTTSEEEMKKIKMTSYAYVLIGTIKNLDIVTYKYKVEGQEYELSINKDEASEFAGYDIKKCGKDIYSLQKLIDKVDIEPNK